MPRKRNRAAPSGRPADPTPELIDEICRRLVDGESLRAICEDPIMPHAGTMMRWVRDDERLEKQYVRARELQGELWAHEIIEIADTSPAEEAQKTKLRVDTRKWLMSRILPKKYGDKLVQEHTGPDGGPIEFAAADKTVSDALAKIEAALRAHSPGKG